MKNEIAEFNFDRDYHAFVPYINDNRAGERYCYSFESYYDEAPLSRMYKDSLAITPLMVELENGKKAVIMLLSHSNSLLSQRFIFGSNASRRPSPTKLKPSTVSIRQIPAGIQMNQYSVRT